MIAKYIGIRYEPKGVPLESADCWTLCRYFAEKELGIHYPEFMYDVETYLSEAADHIAEQYDHFLGKVWMAVSAGDFCPGDLAIFRVKGQVTHCGILVSPTIFLHTLRGRNSCVERLSDWKERLFGVYRYVG